MASVPSVIAAGVSQTLAAFALLACGLALAADLKDFERGLEAYDAGDYEAVVAAWRPLAEAGHAEAQSALGALYLAGEGVPADPAEAARLFRLAAEQGDAVAQLNLGDLLAQGRGISRNLVEAYVWLGLAARQGRQWAEDRRQEIARDLSPTERATAENRIKAWRPKR